MKKFAVLTLAAAAFAGFTAPASARPPYAGVFKATYVDNGPESLKKAVEEVKCNVCHMGTKKTDRNEYGVALSKVFGKEKFDELKGDKAALEKGFAEALKKVESEKSSGGKTFGELLKAGQLPGGK